MAYVDHTFSIGDDEPAGTPIDGRSPVKEIALAAACLGLGSVSMVAGLVMMYHRVGGDKAHGIAFMVLGGLVFMPGIYQSRTAYYAYKGYKGVSFTSNLAAA
ncbi:hypothetical protein SELMODRAFT_116365 [Selaginella moellendorffii]|uniref:Transmembrane protein 230 n=1 Tax=Selaginella moellendorffii TaxID=88036 RepID=D8SG23_SELML|nr:transmembrane protein 230 [Selaginella moellendorffii]EFJ16606.1 hypothetical protein SELMODRAFT_116365 [Selaginella moellendorffii]|eukprot:XP_002982361.1 transmembrane protein 230 [Selaginella moellendorffii]